MMEDLAIIGLGNFGSKYEHTFHNMGYEVVNKLADLLNKEFDKKDCKADLLIFYKNSKKVIIAKPLTYMNLSGESVREIIGKYVKDAKNIIVVYDDLDINCGSLRMRKSGSAGTHNGMRNIIELIKTKDFPRLRVGIGSETEENIIDKVLRKPKNEEKEKLEKSIEKAAYVLKEYIDNRDFDKLMRDINNEN